MKRFVSFLLAIILIVAIPFSVSAVSISDGNAKLKAQFKFGEGPKSGDYSLDYRYYSPAKSNDTKKYPLVIWLHGKNNGKTDGQQINDIINWSSSDLQSRFTSKGAYILAPRAREENGICWDDESMLAPLKAAIDSFISKNKKNIDLNRIYIGGFSMGGMMTVKVISEYPEMFAAAFPYCPPIFLLRSNAAKFKNIPIWITACPDDPTVPYEYTIEPSWNSICKASKVPEDCRLSTLSKVCYPDGTAASSNHYCWFAVRYDMFSSKKGNYPNMSTVNGKGEKVTLTYPNGMINWLCSHTSDYGGGADSSDSSETTNSIKAFIQQSLDKLLNSLKSFANKVSSLFS